MDKNFENLSMKKEPFHTYGEKSKNVPKFVRKIHFQTSTAKKLVTIMCS